MEPVLAMAVKVSCWPTAAAVGPLAIIEGAALADETTDLSSINPADVKSVDVIKDGSSAIYGMRGSNGVIIINTIGSNGN